MPSATVVVVKKGSAGGGGSAAAAPTNNPTITIAEEDNNSYLQQHQQQDSERRSGMTGEAEAASRAMSASIHSETSTRLSELADIDRQFKSRFAQFLLHVRVSIRLVAMLTTPIAALVILLVIVLSGESTNQAGAQNIVMLAKLADGLVQVLREMSTEHTNSLWWILDPTLQSGITWTTGGLTGKGMKDKIQTSDVWIANLKKQAAANLRSISPRLGDLLAVILDMMTGIHDLRYKVQKWRATEATVDAYYGTLSDSMLSAIDLTATLADAKTIQTSQALATWVRGKTAQERERHIIGQAILVKRFDVSQYGDWLNEINNQVEWQERFVAIAPTVWRKKALAFFTGPLFRELEELRYVARESFVPGDSTKYPNISFSVWMKTATAVNTYYKDVRFNLTADIIATANHRQDTSTTALSLYILLAILSVFLSVVMSFLVGWSIDSPWNAMLRMKDRMFLKLREEEQRNLIVNQFVPSDFFAMMGIKSLFEIQLGNCMLKRATVLCNEIRNFAKLSERMAPQQNFQFLSMWLQDNGPVIRRHGGFIEKFRGSGLTAIFADPNDALDAALELLEAMRVRNGEAVNASTQIETGLTIHTGDLMLGTVGDLVRIETAIISEALATALRITRLTTIYAASLLLSKDSFVLLNVEGISARFLGEAGARTNKTRPQVYEVLQPTDEAKLSTLNEFNQGVKLHHDGEFEKAIDLYDSVLEQDPSDVVARRRRLMAENHELIDFV